MNTTVFNTLITAAELVQLANDDDVRVVDCRFDLADVDWGRRVYQKGHIPGAVYADLNHDLSGELVAGVTGRHPLPPVDRFVETLSGWGIDNGTQVVAYDDKSGMFAARLWWMLRWLGHEKVAVLDGGLGQWTAAGGELNGTPPAIRRRTFIPYLRAELEASVDEVTAAMDNSAVHLLDARAEDRYRGENETIDPVAGHIPTALSAPFMANLVEDGRFRSKAELKSHYGPMLGAQGTMVYCGSGVSAAHDILAIVHAGFEPVKLYAGSWSHWITDPNRPVVKADSSSG